jgi:hypothetical protein
MAAKAPRVTRAAPAEPARRVLVVWLIRKGLALDPARFQLDER